MRPISVLNAEGRLFFTVYQEKMATFMRKNGFITQGVQKAFLESVPGCIEHTTLLSEAFRDAKERHRSICVAWIDIANAYGSMRHNFIQFALKWYHVPAQVRRLIWSYYEGLCARVCTNEWSTELFFIGIGVPQGCTASTINFDVGFQLILDLHSALLVGDKGYKIAFTRIIVSKPTYADDVGLVEKTAGDCQTSVTCFNEALDWSRTMKLKVPKCRSLAFRVFNPGVETHFTQVQSTRWSAYDPLLKVNGEPIKFIGPDEVPWFKYLGRNFQVDLRCDRTIAALTAKLKDWLLLVDRTLLTGPMKAWITNHHICSKLAWYLLVYDFSVTQANTWQALIQRYFRRWVGLAASSEASVLYRSNEHFGLNFKHLGDMLQRLQVVKWHIMKYSQDKTCRDLFQYRLARDKERHYGRGRKTSGCLQLEELECDAKIQDIIGNAQRGKTWPWVSQGSQDFY